MERDAISDAVNFFYKIKNTIKDDTLLKTFLQYMVSYGKTKKPLQLVYNEVAALFHDYPNLLHDFIEFLPNCLIEEQNVERQDRDANQLQQHDDMCTPSYMLLPKDYLNPLASHRTENDNQVLNERFKAVGCQKDQSFKNTRRNQYEKILLRCEDDRFELDMLLHSVNATITRVEKMLEKINDQCQPICLEDHLTVLNVRCIERLYEDHGRKVIEILKEKPYAVLPVILSRLKQKQEVWERCRKFFSVEWAQVFVKNHHKSLVYGRDG